MDWRKNPDFIMGNLIIEYFGKYWHEKADVEIRTNHFKMYGYETLVIWEDELKDLCKLKSKLFQFVI